VLGSPPGNAEGDNTRRMQGHNKQHFNWTPKGLEFEGSQAAKSSRAMFSIVQAGQNHADRFVKTGHRSKLQSAWEADQVFTTA